MSLELIMKFYTFIFSLFLSSRPFAQKSYTDSINNFISHYVNTHDAVTGDDRKYLRFYPVNEKYRVNANFEKANHVKWFQMETSGKIKKTFRVYGIARFILHDTTMELTIYQSQSLMDDPTYKNYLFLPFTDLTTGNETYHTGRYLDFMIDDIKNNELAIDFNKAYNPSCAYADGKYNCPVSPQENRLPVAVKAGEMNYAKLH
jgi:uncharacterized protein (DUF1684 family)